jgi:hypothetical protein
VVARDGDIVEEDASVGAAADADPVLVEREALPRAAATRAAPLRSTVSSMSTGCISPVSSTL